MSEHLNSTSQDSVEVPTSSGWPMAAAFGITLLFAGLVTNWIVSFVGAIVMIVSFVGWFREVLPHEFHKPVPIETEPEEPKRRAPEVKRLEVGELGHRARLPLEIYPYRAGILGGLSGGAAMAVTAILYGLIKHHSIWYPINLLAAAGSAHVSAMSYSQLLQFDGWAFTLATILHVIGSALIGLLYGIALPMFPRRPIVLGGLLAPLFWSGLIHATIQIINPALEARIDWVWFMASQFSFGLVAGIVVAMHTKIATMQSLPFAVRAGIETPSTMREKNEEGEHT